MEAMMKRLGALLVVGLLGVLGLAACNPTGDLGLGGTPISVPTTLPATATPDPKSAPTYAEVRAAIERIWQENKDAPGEERMARVNEYLQTLFGKEVHDWHGWVEQVYQTGDGGPYRVALLMRDPFAVGAVQPTPDPEGEAPFADLPLDGLTLEQSQTYLVGQEIAVSGVFTGTTDDPWIAPTSVTPVVDAPTPTPASADALKDVQITLARTPCFGFCPVYDLTIRGDGTVVYTGTGYVATRGRQEGHISTAQVQELLAFFNKVAYTALQPEYTMYEITDLPYATTSLTVDGQTHRVNHYHGDRSAPEKLRLLEDRIDAVVNSAQWIKQGPDDPRKGPNE
jgi:hypothetical protein